MLSMDTNQNGRLTDEAVDEGDFALILSHKSRRPLCL